MRSTSTTDNGILSPTLSRCLSLCVCVVHTLLLAFFTMGIYTVDFMNGDAKSPQHTVVHPMYVSYTSIPTSASATMLSNKHHHHQHSLNHSLNNSNHHLSNSSHALATTTNTNTTTPTAAKKQFRSSSSFSSNTAQQKSSSLHKQFTSNTTNNNNSNANAAAAAAAAANSFLLNNTNTNNNNNNNYYNSSSNSNSKRRHNSATATAAATATNSNTFLIHTHKSNRSASNGQHTNNNSQYNLNKGLMGGGPGSFNGSLLSNSSQYQFNSSAVGGPLHGGSSGRRRQPLDLSPMSTSYNTRSYSTNNSNASNSMLYSPSQGRKLMGPLTSNSIFPANTATAIDLVHKPPAQLAGGYYDDSTAKADHQLYVNGSRRHVMASTPTQDTTPSLSYASLQNSNQNLNSSLKHQAGGSGMTTSLSNSNYSLTNSLNNNHPPSPAPSGLGGSNSGRFARIHSKPKPPKSSSYSNFSNANLVTPNANTNGMGGLNSAGPQPHPRPLSSNFDETFEDDNFSMQNLKPDEDHTYVPFGKPTPGSYFVNKENNNLPSYNDDLNVAHHSSGPSPNNNNKNPSFGNPHSPGILLEKGAVLHPHVPEMNPAQRVLYQQNGLPFHPAYSPVPYRQNSACSSQAAPPRPTNIPLPVVPASYNHHQCSTEMISPSEVTPPPPPQPRPHIFQPRTGTAPYPDLSPDVTERYAMPTQYIPRSPVASRIARRQRQQQNQSSSSASGHHDRSHLANTSANFCDQIRDTPPGYRGHKGKATQAAAGDNVSNPPTMSRARSHDRLSADSHNNGAPNGNGSGGGSFRDADKSSNRQHKDSSKEMAPHVNRRSGRRGEVPKARPRSYCNSMSGGEGVIRANIASDRKMGYAA